MPAETVKVEGEARLRATLAIASSRIDDMTDPGKETARFVEGRGRSDAPVLTGRLAGSLRSSASSTDAEVVSGLPYANRTHWGYRRYHQAAQPFLASVVWNNQDLILRNYRDRAEVVLHGVKGV
jgi:hypothetical protein